MFGWLRCRRRVARSFWITRDEIGDKMCALFIVEPRLSDGEWGPATSKIPGITSFAMLTAGQANRICGYELKPGKGCRFDIDFHPSIKASDAKAPVMASAAETDRMPA